jgi:hypothetical protein
VGPTGKTRPRLPMTNRRSPCYFSHAPLRNNLSSYLAGLPGLGRGGVGRMHRQARAAARLRLPRQVKTHHQPHHEDARPTVMAGLIFSQRSSILCLRSFIFFLLCFQVWRRTTRRTTNACTSG